MPNGYPLLMPSGPTTRIMERCQAKPWQTAPKLAQAHQKPTSGRLPRAVVDAERQVSRHNCDSGRNRCWRHQLNSAQLASTVVVTLIVYWLAERYAELLGSHTHNGRLPSAGHIWSSLAETCPMVTASFLPVASIGVAVLFGASSSDAAQAALIVSVVRLIMHGYTVGRAAGLRGKRLVVVTVIAGLLGVAMVILKSVLQHHHY